MTQKAASLRPEQREKLLRDLWVLNDARWFLKSALDLGPEAANKLNLTVVDSFGKTEIGRLMVEAGLDPISDIQGFKALLELASELYFPPDHVYAFEAIDENTLRGHVLECYVYKAVTKANGTGFYTCAAETRLGAWLEGCGLHGQVTVDRDTESCNGSCSVTFSIDWRRPALA